MQPLEGYQVEAESGRAVALALDLDDDLRREGLAREVVHAVQNARKEAGPRDHRPDRADGSAGTRSCSTPRARTRPTWPGETLANSIESTTRPGAAATIEGRELEIAVSAAAERRG